jgi:hypothetical protein
MAWWDGWSVLVLSPPFIEGMVGADEEALFRWWGFHEGIGDIGTVDQEIFSGSNSIEHSSASLVDAVCICLCKDSNLSRPNGSIANAASFLLTIHRFNGVGPDEMEDGIIFSHPHRLAKHPLIFILV